MDELHMISYPPIARSNWVFKMSGVGGRFMVVADHLLDPKKFFIKYFSNVDEAATYLDYVIYKEENNGNKY